MQRKERVKEFVLTEWSRTKDKGQDIHITAEMTAEALHIWRSDASRDLNSLVREGVLGKTETYPVCFFPRENAVEGCSYTENTQEPFVSIIGYNGSLKGQIQTARAAAAYPPNGLNIFIAGESGVGKTMLAAEIWRYICHIRRDQSVPFVSYNCAEHADNPQLLLSHLFGHKKGTFTGADQDKSGIIELADGGVLFLDEIHRLPGTGQEMLFTVMDKGVYTPLGGVHEKEVHLLIIGATTESTENAVLGTFKRRMPIVLNIPSLKERPLSERLSLVILFFSKESAKLNIPIYVEKEAVRYLIAFESKTNIGDLKNEIQICCARGYLRYIEQKQIDIPYILVETRDLSRTMVLEQSKEASVEEFVDHMIPGEQICITAQNAELKLTDKESASNEKRTEKKKERVLTKSASPDVWRFARQIVETAEIELVEEYSEKTIQAVAFCLEEIRSFAHQGGMLDKLDIPCALVSLQDGKEGTFVMSIRPMIEEHFHLKLMDSEVLLLASILKQHANRFDKEDAKKSRFGLILASACRERAVEMAKNINKIFSAKLAYPAAIRSDMEKDQQLKEVIDAAVKLCDTKGIIILTDEKKLLHDKKYIEKQAGVVCYIIPKMNWKISIEIAKTMLVADDGQEIHSIFNIGRWSGSLEKLVDILMGKKE